MSYSEKLLDPRWQAKRLLILDRDKLTCQLCKDTETTLHIHHRYYVKGFEPWDYDDDALVTYCKHCHALMEGCKKITGFHAVKDAFKYTKNGRIYIYAIVQDDLNERFLCVFEYIDGVVEGIISIPEHIVSRVNSIFESIKNTENGR